MKFTYNSSVLHFAATAIGQGVYFATQSWYSDQNTYSPPDRNRQKRMYRCRVLTGKTTNGRSDMRTPPPINTSQPHVLYDSVSDGGRSMFVIFNDTQAYPEHLITYT